MLIMHETSYGNPIVSGDMNTIRIGKFCSIADSAMFDGGTQHNHQFATTFPLWKIGAPENREGMCRGNINVGNDVWIGDGALIMSGITIGDGAVIGARAVVRRDIAPYEIYCGFRVQDQVGGRSEVKRYRFYPEVIARLLKLAWWNWSEDRILANSPLMLSENIEAFLEANEEE